MKAAPKLVETHIVLDINPRYFNLIRADFVKDLAAVLDVDVTEIRITAVVDHCSEVYLLVPEDKRDLVKLIRSRDSELPEEARKEIANLRRKYRVITAPTVAPPIRTSKMYYKPSPVDRSLTWIHLSDAHFEAPDTGKKLDYWTQNKVASTLVRDLPDLLAAERLSPDIVFFTGDIAFSGSPAEYAIALQYIKELRKVLPQGEDVKFFFVPGNHDVHRSTVQEHQDNEDHAASYLKSNQAVFEYLGSPKFTKDRASVLRRLDNYEKFTTSARDFGHPPHSHGFFYTHSAVYHGATVGIAGLNSAWRSASDEDRGRLVLGVPQLDAAIDDLKDADLRILLMHHPVASDWFIADDMLYQRAHLDHFDLVLRGHQHDANISPKSLTGGCLELSAGALYSHDSLPLSFYVAQVDLDASSLWTFYWRLDSSRFKWVPDVALYTRGFHAFDLPERVSERLAMRTGSAIDPALLAGDSKPRTH